MAARIGAGTGVIVSLVVFVLTTIFLLVLTIVFYAGQTKAKEGDAAAKKALSQYVAAAEMNSDWLKAAQDRAQRVNSSVIRYVQDERDKGMGYLVGNPNEALDVAEQDLKTVGVSNEKSAKDLINDLRRNRADLQAEVDRRKTQLSDSEAEKIRLFEQIGQERDGHQQELQAATAKIEEYRKEAERYRDDIANTINELTKTKDALQSRFDSQISGLNAEIDRLMQENVVFTSRIKDFEARLNEIRIKGANPAMLVDGHIIDAAGSNDQVFIDRGRQHRIVLGMTFEVYDNENAIQLDKQTGEMPRGKASLQVTKVGDTTSTCKVTRAVPGRPVVRNDVVANAIYDPSYKFKFLVHGKFDTEGDGKATDGEADYLRSLIIDWGGTVVTGEVLPGDLDFLVLGEEPPLPPPPRSGASELEIQNYIKARQVRETYLKLKQQAMDAQIPVLNANRFFILIGRTTR